MRSARIELAQDHWETAAALYEEELAVWRETGDPGSIAMVLIELGEVAFGQGELAQARVTMVEAAELFRQADERTWLAATDLYLGLFAVAEARFAEAARLYRACLSGYAETGDAFLQSPLAGLARVAIEAGRPRAQPSCSASLMRSWSAPACGSTSSSASATTRPGRSPSGPRRGGVHGRLRVGPHPRPGRLVRRGRRLLSRPLEAAERGSPGTQQRTAAGLTPRERDILILVADGLSDREVAEALFIGQGTVRSHLTRIFGKLEVGSRTAAIAAARQQGIL